MAFFSLITEYVYLKQHFLILILNFPAVFQQLIVMMQDFAP